MSQRHLPVRDRAGHVHNNLIVSHFGWQRCCIGAISQLPSDSVLATRLPGSDLEGVVGRRASFGSVTLPDLPAPCFSPSVV